MIVDQTRAPRGEVSRGRLQRLRERARILKRDTYALYLAARDPRTPWYAKLLAAAVVAYALSPIDLIPDFIPVIGHLDDLIIVPLGIAAVVRLVPADVLADCRAQAATRMERPASAPADRDRLLRRGLWLEYITLGWNVVGVAVLAVAAVAAHSVALAGFGLDSLIEILASTVVVWQLTDTGGKRERTAMRIIGGAFFALALYIAAQAAYVLATGGPPAPSPLGIAWTAITCVAMLVLAFGKARTGAALSNPVLITEGRVTLVDAYLAGAVLLGLLLNAALGWWWADPLAGFVIVFYGIKEGWEALHHQP